MVDSTEARRTLDEICGRLEPYRDILIVPEPEEEIFKVFTGPWGDPGPDGPVGCYSYCESNCMSQAEISA